MKLLAMVLDAVATIGRLAFIVLTSTVAGVIVFFGIIGTTKALGAMSQWAEDTGRVFGEPGFVVFCAAVMALTGFVMFAVALWKATAKS